MEETAERQLRAYVYVEAAQVINLDKAAGRYVQAVVRNFGETPAKGYRFWNGVQVREWPLDSALPGPPDDLRISVEDMPPGRISIVTTPIGELSEDEERALRNGTAGVYFWGRITYRDVFGGERFTNQRVVCEGSGLAAGLMHPTEEGNDST
jgi:hypothetical protein